MVVGNGLLAKAFSAYEHDENVIIFASGVSNSNNTLQSEFDREIQLWEKYKETDKKLVYFSTIYLLDEMNLSIPYFRHKLEMEARIQASNKDYLIFRLPNIIGKTPNKNTLVNFLANSLRNGDEINIQMNAFRYLFYINDVFTICNEFIQNVNNKNKIFELAFGEPYAVLDLYRALENILNIKGTYNAIKKGKKFIVHGENAKEIAINFGLEIGTKHYLEDSLKKIYKKQD